MDDQNILDAPEGETGGPPKIPIKLVLYTIGGLTMVYWLLFGTMLNGLFEITSAKIWIFRIDWSQLIFLGITSLGLYVFTSFIKFELTHWFRIMTMSVTIVLVAVVLLFFFLFVTESSMFNLLKALKTTCFIALIGGGGCSLAIQFLLKKHYFIFSAIMICTMVVFSLINYL